MTAPKLTILPPDAAPVEILTILYRDGAVVVQQLVSPESISRINTEIKPYMDADYNSGLDVFAKQTKTVCGLAGKSPAAVAAILQQPVVKDVVDDVLTVTTESWWGDSRNTCVSPPLLSSFFTVRVGPGSARQGLHRDDQDHHATHTRGDPRDTTKLGCFIATSEVTKSNGATEIVLGSHTWDDTRKPSTSEITYGEMSPGDALFMLGNTYHGAGANVTSDSFRSVIVTLFCKGVYRSEENQFLAVNTDTARGLPEDVQDLLGWRASAPFCGWHDLAHPWRLIREGGGVGGDLF